MDEQLTILKKHFTFHFDLDFEIHFYNRWNSLAHTLFCGKSHSSAPLSRLKQMPRIRIICTFTPCLAHNTYRKHQGTEEALRGRQRGDEKTVKRSENSRSLVLMVWIGCSSGRAPVIRQHHRCSMKMKQMMLLWKCNSRIHKYYFNNIVHWFLMWG